MLALDSPGIASMIPMLSSLAVLSASAMPTIKLERRLVTEQLSTRGSRIFRTADKHLAGDRHERALLKVCSLAALGVNQA